MDNRCHAQDEKGVQKILINLSCLRGMMLSELGKAHQANDRAVMQAYGFDVKTMTEGSCVAALMKMYLKLTERD